LRFVVVNRGFRLPAFGGLRFTHGNGLAALRACVGRFRCGGFRAGRWLIGIGEECLEAVLRVERWRDGGVIVFPGRHTSQYSPAAAGCKWNLVQ
jgi:hypothetical protein